MTRRFDNVSKSLSKISNRKFPPFYDYTPSHGGREETIVCEGGSAHLFKAPTP